MEPKLQRRVQRYGWDKAVAFYEQGWQAQLAGAQGRLIELAAARPGERVLDVACGTGLVTFPLAKQVGPGGSVVGTDISEEMVRAAEKTAAERGFGNVTFHHAGAEDLPLPDGGFDLAVCSLGLMYVPDPALALREMHRTLRPGGRLAVLVWGRRSHCGWAEIFPIVDARVKSEVCPLFFQLGGADVLQGEIGGAGFANVEIEPMACTLAFAGGEEACLAAFAGGPVALAYQHFDEPTRQQVHGAYLASIASYKKGSSYEIPAEFVFGTGEKLG